MAWCQFRLSHQDLRSNMRAWEGAAQGPLFYSVPMPTAGSLHLSRGPAPGHWSTSAAGPKAGAGGLSDNRGSGHPGVTGCVGGGEAHLGLSERKC